MSVTLYELRKIFGWKRVLLTSLVWVTFYFLTIDHQVHFVTRGGGEAEYKLAVQMIEEFGVWMNREDLAKFQEASYETLRRFNELVQSSTELQELGITSPEQMRNYYWNELFWNDELRHEEVVNLAFELQARQNVSSSYESRMRGWGIEQLASAQQERQQELMNREAQSILTTHVFLGYRQMIAETALLVVLSLVIMISPIYLMERRNRMFFIQYTTKLGRNLFHKKVIASIMAAIIITTIQLGVIFTLYSRQGTSMFFPADINSFFNADHISWLDITFGQYIWLTIGLVYLISLIMAVLIPFLSRLSPNYLAVMGIQIPIVLILINRLFDYLIIAPTSIIFPPYLVPSIYAGLIFLVVGLTVLQWLREKKIDINI